MPGYYFLTLILVANSGISHNTPAPEDRYSWEQCQKAGKFAVKNFVGRNIGMTFSCVPTPATTDKLPAEETK